MVFEKPKYTILFGVSVQQKQNSFLFMQMHTIIIIIWSKFDSFTAIAQ